MDEESVNPQRRSIYSKIYLAAGKIPYCILEFDPSQRVLVAKAVNDE